MIRLNKEFLYEESGFFSLEETKLEDEIINYIDNKENKISNEAFIQIGKFREQLVEWYPFEKEGTILEIGGGFGSVTGTLCNKMSKVVCLEVKKRRSEIIKKRWREKQNLEVIYSPGLKYNGNLKFDYVFIHDTAESIQKYIRINNNTLCDYLLYIKQFLKKNGRVLFVSENRLGLKYFSGAIEEFSQKLFTGLNQFDGYNTIYSYTMNEIKMYAERSGFLKCNFYYLFPDCILPTDIYTDEILNYIYYGGNTRSLEVENLYLFNEQRMFRTLQREGCLSHFVNTFFVELLLDETEDSNKILYYANGYGLSSQYTSPLCIYENNCKELMFVQNGKKCLLPNGKRFDFILADMLDLFYKDKKYISENLYKLFALFCDYIRYFSKGNMPEYIRIEHFMFDNEKWFPLQWNLSKEDVELDYVIWEMIYSWYQIYINGIKSFEEVIDNRKLFDACKIDKKNIKRYQEKRNSKTSNKVCYKEKFSTNMIYNHDVILYGNKIIDGMAVDGGLSEKTKTIIQEREILECQKELYSYEINR